MTVTFLGYLLCAKNCFKCATLLTYLILHSDPKKTGAIISPFYSGENWVTEKQKICPTLQKKWQI